MTPNEKARQIFNKMIGKCASDNGDQAFILSRDCALIAVDEFIEECFECGYYLRFTYWLEVKKAIENL